MAGMGKPPAAARATPLAAVASTRRRYQPFTLRGSVIVSPPPKSVLRPFWPIVRSLLPVIALPDDAPQSMQNSRRQPAAERAPVVRDRF
jgi:hypothetical protein